MDKDTANMGTEEKGEDNPAYVVEEPGLAEDISKVNTNYGEHVEKGLEEEPERQQWSNPIEFLLSCIAMSVSLSASYLHKNVHNVL